MPGALDGPEPTLLPSGFGHDAFLIERDAVGAALTRLLST
jgi:homoserine O-acetyltransferase